MQRVTILGATGSIGQSTLDVISSNPDRYEVFALSANSDWEALASLCERFRPAVAVIAQPEYREQLAQRLKVSGVGSEVLSGAESLVTVAAMQEADTVVAAIVGAAGLLPTLAAARAGKRILLANKEALVMSGQLFIDSVKQHHATLLPVDSEHNAIFQCLPTAVQADAYMGALDQRCGMRRILLTASGGPFLGHSLADMQNVTPGQACRHPKWSMGRKISVDSATLMNKGLELIEACYLFGVSTDQVDVHIHPEAIIHSMVEYLDGSIIAQLGSPDMRTPIANALAWPERTDAGVSFLDLFSMGSLNFSAPDLARFPCLGLAASAFEEGGLKPTQLNAANEIAVEAFLQEQIGFMQIPDLVSEALQVETCGRGQDLESILEEDRRTRSWCRQWVTRVAGRVEAN